MSTWTNEKHEAARQALDEDMSQWGTEYGDAALDEIERLRALTTTTDDKIKRAADVLEALDGADLTEQARVALEAALTPKENEA